MVYGGLMALAFRGQGDTPIMGQLFLPGITS